MFDLGVERPARVLAQNGGDVVIELSILAMQGHHRDADHGEDELQLAHVLAHVEPELVIRSGLGEW